MPTKCAAGDNTRFRIAFFHYLLIHIMKLIPRLARSAFEAVGLLREILAEIRSRNAPPAEEVWLDTLEVAQILHVTARTIYTYKSSGILKPGRRIGRRDYYRQSDIFRLI
ncbi:hypothetical protein DDR33_02520 [Pararcticibacter amylolyticus]|uniref:Helix-turn-helix domain-containing protein n=2 Tax=Pararcticibacter amylolyticus TaxID=2173175 RepID=A0A2U2PKJ0_9SPHI|nr:hypothetical protein DDR33_02520 [Pararcticibacter amylolyticus]